MRESDHPRSSKQKLKLSLSALCCVHVSRRRENRGARKTTNRASQRSLRNWYITCPVFFRELTTTTAACITAFYWDWLINLDREWALLWCSRWSRVKVLYILVCNVRISPITYADLYSVDSSMWLFRYGHFDLRYRFSSGQYRPCLNHLELIFPLPTFHGVRTVILPAPVSTANSPLSSSYPCIRDFKIIDVYPPAASIWEFQLRS